MDDHRVGRRQGRATFTARHVISSAPIRELIADASSRCPPALAAARQAALPRLPHRRADRRQARSLPRQLDLHPRSERAGRPHPEFPLLVAGDGARREAVAASGSSTSASRATACGPRPTSDLIALAKREIAQIGLAGEDEVDGCVVRQKKAYPVYDDDYKTHVEHDPRRPRGALSDAAPRRPQRHAQVQQPGSRDDDGHADRARTSSPASASTTSGTSTRTPSTTRPASRASRRPWQRAPRAAPRQVRGMSVDHGTLRRSRCRRTHGCCRALAGAVRLLPQLSRYAVGQRAGARRSTSRCSSRSTARSGIRRSPASSATPAASCCTITCRGTSCSTTSALGEIGAPPVRRVRGERPHRPRRDGGRHRGGDGRAGRARIVAKVMAAGASFIGVYAHPPHDRLRLSALFRSSQSASSPRDAIALTLDSRIAHARLLAVQDRARRVLLGDAEGARQEGRGLGRRAQLPGAQQHASP